MTGSGIFASNGQGDDASESGAANLNNKTCVRICQVLIQYDRSLSLFLEVRILMGIRPFIL